MAAIYKFLATEITLSTSANNVGGQKLIRLLNENITTNHLMTQKDSGGNTVCTFSIKAGGELVVEKGLTDTFQVDSGTDVLAVPVAYRN